MSVSRNIIKNPKLVPGGGATELTVSATLKQKSATIEGIEKVGYVSFLTSKPMLRSFQSRMRPLNLIVIETVAL